MQLQEKEDNDMFLFKKKKITELDYRKRLDVNSVFRKIDKQFDALQKSKLMISILMQRLVDIQEVLNEYPEVEYNSGRIIEIAQHYNITEKEAFNKYAEIRIEELKEYDYNIFKVFRDSIFEAKNLTDPKAATRFNQFQFNEFIQIALDLGLDYDK